MAHDWAADVKSTLQVQMMLRLGAAAGDVVCLQFLGSGMGGCNVG